jgi:hypothetical protein
MPEQRNTTTPIQNATSIDEQWRRLLGHLFRQIAHKEKTLPNARNELHRFFNNLTHNQQQVLIQDKKAVKIAEEMRGTMESLVMDVPQLMLEGKNEQS